MIIITIFIHLKLKSQQCSRETEVPILFDLDRLINVGIVTMIEDCKCFNAFMLLCVSPGLLHHGSLTLNKYIVLTILKENREQFKIIVCFMFVCIEISQVMYLQAPSFSWNTTKTIKGKTNYWNTALFFYFFFLPL